MTSSNVYKQSVFEHRSILLLVSILDDGSLNVKKCNKLASNICQQFEVVKVRSVTNNEADESSFKNVYFNFKRNYTEKEKEWGNFQLHHRALGLLFVGEFKQGPELNKILKVYASEKEKGIGTVIESRLILIYDESDEDRVRSIIHSLHFEEDMCSSDSLGDGNIIGSKLIDFDCELELSYIKDSSLQSDIIWYQKSLIGGSDTNSKLSLTDSSSSTCSSPWKNYSDNTMASPLKSSTFSCDFTNDNPQKPLNCPETRQIHSFLVSIYEKLFTGLLARESALVTRSDQVLSRGNNLETSSDSGSMMSLDDTDFNLSDPVDIDWKRFQDESRFNKSNKSRHYLGRLAKQTGDYAMLCGNYWQSYHYYQLSICYLKKYNNDQLWLAGAEEGLCCAWIAFNFDNKLRTFDSEQLELLHTNCRQAFLNQMRSSLNQTSQIDVTSSQNSSPSVDQIDLSFLKKFSTVDLFKNPPEILSLDELNDKYLLCINRYKKSLRPKADSIHPINIDSCIKASRFFIDCHRYLDASNFLKMIKTDLIDINHDNEMYHNTLAKLYSQMGFTRKSMLHKYQSVELLQAKLASTANDTITGTKNRLSVTNALPKQKISEKKLSLISDILMSFTIDVGSLLIGPDNSVEDRVIHIIDNDKDRQFDTLKMKMVSELFVTCKGLNYGVNTLAGLGLSLLDNWHRFLTKIDCQRLIEDVNIFCRSESHKNNRFSKLCFVKNFPRLTKVVATTLPDYLIPKRKKENCLDSKSIFIYTPLNINNRNPRTMIPETVVWVCGEECEVVLQFDNLLPVPLQLSGVEFLLNGADRELWVPSEGSSIHLLPGNSRNIYCHFVIIPARARMPPGEYRITNISYQIPSIYNVTFYPIQNVIDSVLQCSVTPAINICPMLPQMKLFSSLPEQTSSNQWSQGNIPLNTVVCTSVTVYDNEVFDFTLFLSNESKDLNIDRVTCVLDELELSSGGSSTLISRVANDEFNNRQKSTFRMLSLLQEHLIKTLSIKSISSLKNATVKTATSTADCELSLPTDVTLKFRIDATDRQFVNELFTDITLPNIDESLVNPIWRGQFRVTFRYGSHNNVLEGGGNDKVSLSSDVDEEEEEQDSQLLYRESVCVINCQLVLGLCLIGYRIDRDLDLVMTLMNFSENKMNVDVFWRDSKINLNHLVIVPICGQISQCNNLSPLKRLSSTECSSHILIYRINAEILGLKSLLDNGEIFSEEDLTVYIQSNLRIVWTMKDRTVDKIRQGNVNLNWCLCHSGQQLIDLDCPSQVSIAHQLAFTINDIIKIRIWNNMSLEIFAFTHDDNVDSPVPPKSPVDELISVNIFESVRYKISCHFRQKNWSESIPEEIINRIVFKCVVTTVTVTHIGDSLSGEDNYVLGGNTVQSFTKASIVGTELNGLVLFLVPGTYSLFCQLLIGNDHSQLCHGIEEVFGESDKYDIHVT